jgi:hypothetical protein
MDPTETFGILKTSATIMWAEYGEWAYDTWVDYNATYFDNRLAPAGIIWAVPPRDRFLSHYDCDRQIITLHSDLLESSEANPWGLQGWLNIALASDALLHAMIHQLTGTGGSYFNAHNNTVWVSEVNRIAPALGLRANAALIPQKKTTGSVHWVPQDGCMSIHEMARWPILSRPERHFEATVWQRFGRLMRP